MLCLGIDPDLHDLAIASWDDLGPVAAHVVHVPKRKGVVENEAVLAMMTALSGGLPYFGRQLPPRFEGDGFDVSPDWCAVESQELARGPQGQHRRPQDIVTLGQVAGMALMRVARGYLHGCGLYFPKPSEWKGSVPKAVMQARLYAELGWGYEVRGSGGSSYAVPHQAPTEFSALKFKTSQFKHIGDALLLARWCWEQAQGRKWTKP